MKNELSQKMLKYVYALGFVALAYLLWWLTVKPSLGYRAISGFMFIAVILSGRYAGFGPSCLALALGGCCVTYVHTLRYSIDDPNLPGVIFIYLVLTTTLALLTRSERAARQIAETNSHLLRQEIGERMAVEQQLREEHQQLALALAAGRFGTFEWDVRSGTARWSATNEAIHGFSPGTFSGTIEQAMVNIHPSDQKSLRNSLASAGETTPAKPLAYRVSWPDGSTHWIEGVGQFVCNAEGRLDRLRGVCADITARKQIEIALSEAEERFRLLALHAPVGIYLADETGRFTFANHQWCEIAGAQFDESLGLDWTNCVHPDDAQRLKEGWATCVQNNEAFSAEYRYLHKNGRIRWVDGSAVILRNERGEVLGHVGTVMDITDRKESEDALRVEQELLRQSIELHERERTMIAYDIHDGIIQYTTGALMFLESFKGQRKGTADAEQIEPVLSALRQAIADGRRVMNGIRPPLLDDVGVVAAIEYLASENQMAATEIEFVIDEDLGRLAPEVETALYRIAQEALFNAVKHSGSGRIQISLCRVDENIRLMVRDWGRGFDLGKVSRGVHGLSGIRERAKLLGGQSTIHSSPSEGTCVSVELPFIERVERLPQPVA